MNFTMCVPCSCHHELETARLNGLLGNIDANTGDPQIGITVYINCFSRIFTFLLPFYRLDIN